MVIERKYIYLFFWIVVSIVVPMILNTYVVPLCAYKKIIITLFISTLASHYVFNNSITSLIKSSNNYNNFLLYIAVVSLTIIVPYFFDYIDLPLTINSTLMWGIFINVISKKYFFDEG